MDEDNAFLERPLLWMVVKACQECNTGVLVKFGSPAPASCSQHTS